MIIFLTKKNVDGLLSALYYSFTEKVYPDRLESEGVFQPVLGADIGGIPELIRPGETGELFEAGNADDLKAKILKMWNDKELLDKYSANCRYLYFDTADTYCDKLMQYYKG